MCPIYHARLTALQAGITRIHACLAGLCRALKRPEDPGTLFCRTSIIIIHRNIYVTHYLSRQLQSSKSIAIVMASPHKFESVTTDTIYCHDCSFPSA